MSYDKVVRRSNVFAGDFLQINGHHDIFELVSNKAFQTSCFSYTATGQQDAD